MAARVKPDGNVEEEQAKDELTALYLEDLELFAEDCLRILTKSAKLIPLTFNRAQRYIHEQIEKQLREKGYVRVLILKGRQQGCSTYVEARFYWKVIHTEGIRAYILTHEDEATQTLFQMAERFHSNNPDAPVASRSSAKELHFDLMDSGYRVGTAGNKATGRSKTIQLFHGSEVAHWPNADAHKSGVMQAIPNELGTESILESTAFGVGGMFHSLWKEAEAALRGDIDPKTGQPVVCEYIPIFVPWFWQPEYSETPPDGFKPSADEKQLVKLYGLTDGQLYWRRKKISTLRPSEGGNPEDLFKQEYPCNPEEAFLFSGRLVFTASKVLDARAECFSPKHRAELSGSSIEKREDGRLWVWKEPQAGKRYVIGADVAEGLIKGDYSSASIREVGTGRQVAKWHGHIPPDQFGEVLVSLGNYYNTALLGIERNNHGLTVLTKVRDLSYKRIYVQEDLAHRADDKQTKKLGWLTTEQSKLKIIDQLAAELRDGSHGIVDVGTIDEMGTYVIDENGKFTAKPGCYDDQVMSYAIAGEMLRHAPTQHEVGSTDKKRDWVY